MKKSALLVVTVFLAVVITVIVSCIALHRSNNVLDSFRIMDEKFEKTNTLSNTDFPKIETRVMQHESKPIQKKGREIEKSSNELYSYIENLKTQMLAEVNMTKDSINFAVMDKPSQLLFKNDREIGNQFISKIEAFGTEMILNTKGFSNENLIKTLQDSFETHNRTNLDWLTYEFDDFPIIASYTKLTAIQSGIKQVQTLGYRALLSKK